MKIHSFRLGFANNSSSTHSIVFFPPNTDLKDDACNRGDFEFGWNEFTAISPERKRGWLAGVVAANLRGGDVGWGAAVEALKVVGKEAKTLYKNRGYVDHQSVPDLPRNPYGGLNYDFIDEMDSWLSHQQIGILGGNDNDSHSHEALDITGAKVVNLPRVMNSREGTNDNLICRQDKVGDRKHWVLFDKSNGAKFRLSFTDTDLEARVTKGQFAELADVKITDFCPIGCEFCYQGSTTKGKHASMERVRQAADYLSGRNVFEVALGGGEPTMHPQFLDIVEAFKSKRIVTSFTSKSWEWMKDPGLRRLILRQIGSFAFSVDGLEDVMKLAKMANEDGYDFRKKYTAQFVMGASPISVFNDVLYAAKKTNTRLTLLGFKETGRGVGFKRHDYKDWVNVVKTYSKDYGLVLGIDTSLAKESESELKSAGIPRMSFETEEGKFSMYLDLVSNTFGPSSYCPKKEMKKIPVSEYKHWENKAIDDAFATW